MMLAGIVLTISFILTALTLSQVASLEREAAAEEPNPMVNEWRFLHERLGSNLKTAISADTNDDTYLNTVLATVQATFRSVEAEKGYDLVIRSAGDPVLYDPTGSEADLIDGVTGKYEAYSWDGRIHFNELVPGGSNVNDGILWDASCPDLTGPASCIGGVYVYVRLSDGTATLEESILFAVNQ